jgi:toxin-antitoxin system PIN domain toxin
MKLPDINVLVYAFRPSATQHAVARSWLEKTIADPGRFALSKLALAGVVRVLTNLRASTNPTPLADAFAFCDSLLAQPNCEIIEPGERHWDIFRDLCVATGTRGGDTTDAWYAALAIEWGCEWVTFDRDFLKFPGLKCTILPA